MKAFKSFEITLVISYLICLLWAELEKILYGEVQPRTVDDIITLVFMAVLYVFVYKSLDKGGKEND